MAVRDFNTLISLGYSLTLIIFVSCDASTCNILIQLDMALSAVRPIRVFDGVSIFVFEVEVPNLNTPPAEGAIQIADQLIVPSVTIASVGRVVSTNVGKSSAVCRPSCIVRWGSRISHCLRRLRNHRQGGCFRGSLRGLSVIRGRGCGFRRIRGRGCGFRRLSRIKLRGIR